MIAFDAEHSPLQTDPAKLDRYIALLQEALGDEARVVGILEIGSYAKGEAVPGSDIDTRVFATSPRVYYWQAIMGQFSESQRDMRERFYARFTSACGHMPQCAYTWSDFNQPVAEQISADLRLSIEFGIADARYAAFEFEHHAESPFENHSFLFQSNILYDPDGLLAEWRGMGERMRCPALNQFYRERYLDSLPFEIYRFLNPDPLDGFKATKSGQIQWVKWAVRCLRDAVATRWFERHGEFIYKKRDILDLYSRYLPDHFEYVQRVYTWKTDPECRRAMVADFAIRADKYFTQFREMMPELEAVVKRVRSLQL